MYRRALSVRPELVEALPFTFDQCETSVSRFGTRTTRLIWPERPNTPKPRAMRPERQEMAGRAQQLRSQGLTLKQIGARLGRSEGEISKLLRAPAPTLNTA